MTAISFHNMLTLIFFVAFVVMVVWVYLPARKGHYDNAANLPFEGDAQSKGEAKHHE